MKGGFTCTWLVHTLGHLVCSSKGDRLAFLRERGGHLTIILGCAGRYDNGYFHMHWGRRWAPNTTDPALSEQMFPTTSSNSR